MDNIKLIVFAFFLFFISFISEAATTYSVTYNGITYTSSTVIGVCDNNDPLNSKFSGFPRSSGSPGSYVCNNLSNATAALIFSLPIVEIVSDPVCTSTEQLINHVCVADPVCTSTEQLINHVCVADPVCTSTEQLINHVCVADPVCTSTEQLINHVCVADPVCSLTEQLINHQCVADPVCTSTEYLSNHICVPDPVCTSTELLTNHVCVPDPVCTSTELLINHACIANPNLNTNPDVVLPSSSSRIYYTQTVVGTTLHTKIGTKSGSILSVTANDVPLNPYVGVYWDPADGSLYYSYKSVIDVGSGTMMQITYRDKISYDSMADMIVNYRLNTADPEPVASVDNYFQFLDFFFKPAEAFLALCGPFALQCGVIATEVTIAILVGAVGLAYNALNRYFAKPKSPTYAGDCILAGIGGGYASPSAACDHIFSNNTTAAGSSGSWVEAHVVDGALKFVCWLPSGMSGGGACTNWTVSDETILPPGVASDEISRGLKNNLNSPDGPGKFGKGSASRGVGDLLKAINDGFKANKTRDPSSKDPFGDIKHPSDTGDYQKGYPDKPDSGIEPFKSGDKRVEPEKPSVDLGKRETAKPDGSKTQTHEQLGVKVDPAFPNTIITEKTITTTETTVNNTSTTTVEKASPDPAKVDPNDSIDNSKDSDPCAKDPTIIGCSHWGTPDAPEEIPTHEMDISLTPGASDSGSCPADKQITLSIGVVPISFEPICQLAGFISPILISFSWLSAGFILFGAVKES